MGISGMGTRGCDWWTLPKAPTVFPAQQCSGSASGPHRQHSQGRHWTGVEGRESVCVPPHLTHPLAAPCGWGPPWEFKNKELSLCTGAGAGQSKAEPKEQHPPPATATRHEHSREGGRDPPSPPSRDGPREGAEPPSALACGRAAGLGLGVWVGLGLGWVFPLFFFFSFFLLSSSFWLFFCLFVFCKHRHWRGGAGARVGGTGMRTRASGGRSSGCRLGSHRRLRRAGTRTATASSVGTPW